ITADDHTNSVMVQAAPADMAEIRELIAKIDNNIPRATNVVRVVYLNNAVADDLANLIRQALIQEVYTPTVTPGVAPAAAPGALPGAVGLRPPTKNNTIQFISTLQPKEIFKTGVLEDMSVTSDPRTNSLVVAAPAESIGLLLALIRDLDVPPRARAQ